MFGTKARAAAAISPSEASNAAPKPIRRRTVRRASSIGASLLEMERLHGDGLGRAADGAQSAPDAFVGVVEVEGERSVAGPGLERLPRLEPDLDLLGQREADAVLRADVGAPPAQDALLAVEDRMDVAVEATAGL